MKKAKKSAKPAAKKKPAAAATKKAAKPAAKNAPAPRASTGTTAKPASTPSAWTPGEIQGIGWKPFRYPPE